MLSIQINLQPKVKAENTGNSLAIQRLGSPSLPKAQMELNPRKPQVPKTPTRTPTPKKKAKRTIWKKRKRLNKG